MKKKGMRATSAGGTEAVSVRCSPEVRQAAKVYAAKNRRAMQDVVDAAITEYVKRDA